MNNPTHIPRGFMCCECVRALSKCNQLVFAKMQVIGTFKGDNTKEVKCTEFTREEEINE